MVSLPWQGTCFRPYQDLQGVPGNNLQPYTSSVPSKQSLYPSHTDNLGMHCPEMHFQALSTEHPVTLTRGSVHSERSRTHWSLCGHLWYFWAPHELHWVSEIKIKSDGIEHLFCICDWVIANIWCPFSAFLLSAYCKPLLLPWRNKWQPSVSSELSG